MTHEETVRCISARVEKVIDEKVFPGCVIGVVRADGERMVLPFGRFTYEAQASAVKSDSVYDMASVTKSIPTASLLLLLIDRGRISLDDRLVKYIPEFGNLPGKEKVSVRHLLTYTLDIVLPPMRTFLKKTPDEIVATALAAPLKSDPGTRYVYGNPTALFIGLLIRRVSGRDIDAYAEEEFFSPLGMHSSTFHPETINKENIVPTEFDPSGKLIHGEVHDESTSVLNKKFILGISGLFSTASDTLNFLEMLIQGGRYRGRRYFSESTIDMMETNQIPHISGEFSGLGWELNQPWFMGTCAGPHTFGKTGFTGTCVVCDRGKRIAYVILSNRIFPKRPENSSAINAFRADIGNILLSS
jgi:CubicO group peptidase (beta-lactamase class C family)